MNNKKRPQNFQKEKVFQSITTAELSFLRYLEKEAPIEKINEEIKKEENHLKNLEVIAKHLESSPDLPFYKENKQEIEISQLRLAVLHQIHAQRQKQEETKKVPLGAKVIFLGVILFGFFIIPFLLLALIGNWAWLIWGILVLIFIFGTMLPQKIWLAIQIYKKSKK